MSITAKQAADVWARAERLCSPDQVAGALDRMARDIEDRLFDVDPLLLAVMTGGIVPAGLLLPRLRFPLRLDYVHATRYRGQTAGGQLHWIQRPTQPLAGKTVLLIDDILDEGITLAEIARDCQEQGAREVLTAVLVEKVHLRKNGYRADFVGMEVTDRYLFGCGMDYKDYLRNADGIYAVANDLEPRKQ